MSRPRVRRTVTGTRARSSSCRKAAMRSLDEPSYRPPAAVGGVFGRASAASLPTLAAHGLYGMRFTLKWSRPSSSASARACSGASFTRASITYSTKTRRLVVSRVPAALGRDVRDRVPLVHRHDPRPQLVVRSVQREREPDRLVHLVDEPSQSRQPADRRDRRSPVRDAEIGQPPRRREHLVEVEHRLAHPHEHGMVDLREPPKVERLVEDLRRRQVAPERHRARRAERARQRAARLRGEAERAPTVAVAHEHGLDRMAVRRAEERLHRAVARLTLSFDRQRGKPHSLRELLAQRARQVRHRVVAGRAARGPLPDLPDAEGRLAALAQRLLEEGQVHRATVASRR